MKLTISPLRLWCIAIGLVLQPAYGWHWPSPTDPWDLIWMVVHIFVMPTVVPFAVILAVFVVSALIVLACGGRIERTGPLSWKIVPLFD